MENKTSFASKLGSNYFFASYYLQRGRTEQDRILSLWLLRVWDAPYNKGVYEGAYTASGAFGQFITIILKLDLVIAHKTKYDYERQVSTDIYLKILGKLVAVRKQER